MNELVGDLPTLKGDLIRYADYGLFDVIIHGCNCGKVMGAGIAKQLAQRWPEVEQADKDEPYPQLGSFSYADVTTRIGLPLRVYNLYTQHLPGRNFELRSLEAALNMMTRHLAETKPDGARIGLPMIGCGIGGGDWEKVKRVVDIRLGSYSPIYVEYSSESSRMQIAETTLDILAHSQAAAAQALEDMDAAEILI